MEGFNLFNKRKMLAGSLSFLSALALVGCGGGETADSGGSQGTGGSDGDKELTFMFRGGEDEKKAYQAAINAFEDANPGVSVNVISTDADQYATKLQAAIAGNDIPDVFYVEQGDVMAYVDNGILKDITEEVENSDFDIENVWEYGINSYRYDGKNIGQGNIYGLPKDVGPFALGYNKAMFEEAGIDLPDPDTPYTFEEFVEVGKQLTKDNDGDGELDQWATGFNVNWSLHAFVWSNGGEYLSEDYSEVLIDSPEFIEALQYFADLQNVHGLTPSIAQAQTLDTYQRWMNGEIAFFPVGPWDMSTYATLDFEYDLVPWPAGKTGVAATYIGSLGIGVSEATKHVDEAIELAMYLSTSKEGQQQLVDAQIQIPNLIDMADEWAADTESVPNNKKEFVDIVGEYGRALPAARTYTAEWYDEFFINIQPVLDGEQTAEEYVKQVQPRMQELLDASIIQHEQSAN